MSKVRECDRHGGSFSERAEGWAEGNLIIHRRFDDGSPNDERIAVDYCSNCVNILQGQTPENMYPDHYHHDESARKAIPRYDPEYTKQMERQSLFTPMDTPGKTPLPGDKIKDDRPGHGEMKTVLEPNRAGLACHCGVPTFGEHYHGYPPEHHYHEYQDTPGLPERELPA